MAIKICDLSRFDAEIKAQFDREIANMEMISHYNVVGQIHRVISSNKSYYAFAMELAEGKY